MLGAALVLLVLGAQPARAPKGLAPNDPLAELLELKGNERWKKLLSEMEPKELWKAIHWTSIHEAQKVGAETKRPMLVTIKTGSKGEANAPYT